MRVALSFIHRFYTPHSTLSGSYFDHRGAQEFVAEAVAPLHLLHDCVGFDFFRLLGGDGLVDVRVEEVADRRHHLDPEAFEHAAELSVNQLDALQGVAGLLRLPYPPSALRLVRALGGVTSRGE